MQFKKRGAAVLGLLTLISGLVIGSAGTKIDKVVSSTASIDFASIPASYCTSATMTLTGANVGDVVALDVGAGMVASSTSSATQEGIAWYGAVTSANTVTIVGCNVSSTSATANLTANTFRSAVISF